LLVRMLHICACLQTKLSLDERPLPKPYASKGWHVVCIAQGVTSL
jgi:hypothetical protein